MKNVVVALGAFLAMSCGGSSASPIEQFISAWQHRVDNFCSRCAATSGWTSEAHCRGNEGTASALRGDLSATERECMRAIYTDNSAVLDDVLLCYTRAFDQYTACSATCPMGSDTCFSAYSTSDAACRDGAPTATLDSLTACAPPAG